jgi:PST family polysaccharide transporter
MVVLARLLTPADWGVVALANLVFGVVLLFFDVGTTTALIQTPERTDDVADYVFYFNLSLGIFWYIVIWLISPMCGAFFGDDLLPGVLRVMALFLLITPVASVHHTLLTKQLRFKTKFYIEFYSILIGSGTSTILALAGWHVWSLVFGGIATQLCLALFAWTSVPWRPRRPSSLYRSNVARRLARFGSAVSLQACLVWLVNTVDNLLVGRWLKARELGLYELGFRVGTWPATQITITCSNMFFPIFSRIQNDSAALRHAYLRAIHIVSLLTVPFGVGIATTCSLFVPLYLGPQWVASVPVIQFVSVYGTLASIGGLMTPLCNALGRPEVVVKYLTFSALTAVPAYILAVPHGIGWVAFTHLFLACLRFPLDVMIPSSLLRLPYRDLWNAVRVQVIGSLLMGIIVAILSDVTTRLGSLNEHMVFAGVVGTGCGFYIAVIYLFHRETFRDVVTFLQGIFARPMPEERVVGGAS